MNGYQKGTAVLGLLLLLIVVGAIVRQERQPKAVQLVPALTGRPELCLTCHQGIEEISPSHPTESFGCVLCHGGDGLALDKELAHATLRGGRNPSDLAVVEESCGGSACHSGAADDGRDHIHRVLTSVQATYAGAIAQINFAFGGQADPAAHFGIVAVADGNITTETGVASLSPFQPGPDAPGPVQTFANECLRCHVSAAAINQPYFYRAAGCAACHVIYENDGLYRGDDPTTPKDVPGYGRTHQLTTAIPYTQCNHCHNRGNYSLRQMAFLERDDLPGQPNLSAQEQRELEKLSIEHIAAQHPKDTIVADHSVLPEIDEEFQEIYLHAIGNLTFDPISANIDKSNNDVKVKLQKYFRRAPYKTQNELDDFLVNDRWGAESVINRGNTIADFALDYWDFQSV